MKKEITNSVNVPRSDKLCAVSAGRLLSLTGCPNRVAKVGRAMPLLCALIVQSGECGECRITYGDMAKQLGVSAPTVKNWAEHLKTHGYIRKIPRGPQGLRVVIDEEKIGHSPLLDRGRRALGESVERVTACRDVIVQTMDGLIASMREQEQALA